MKKIIIIILKITITICLLSLFTYITSKLEFYSQQNYIDNIIGSLPFILLFALVFILVLLVWLKRKGINTWTIVLVALAVIWSILLIPAVTGNWYPMAKSLESGSASPDLSVYDPFIDSTKTAQLPQRASLSFNDELPILDGATALYPVYSSFVNAVYDERIYTKNILKCTNTSNAYKAIIKGDCDIIFVAGASIKQKQAAKDAGVELVYTPIGREAFVFLVAKSNPIDGLTYQQIKNIYSGKTAYWKTLGWKDGGKIIAFQRPEGSGSQTGLQNIMGSLPIQTPQPLPDDSLVGTGSMMRQVSVEWNGVQPAIGYSYRFYANTMFYNQDVKMLSIDGVYPSIEAISSGNYPFTADFYAVTNGQPQGNIKKLIDWILSDEGQYLIEKTGYIPIGNN